jgi:hypothetical protein
VGVGAQRRCVRPDSGDEAAGRVRLHRGLDQLGVCEETNRRFDNLPGPASALVDYPGALSFQRRVLYVLPDGRKVLQDTDTSMEDFVKAVRTPGWIPDSLGR